ncbi:MAG TPA: response regulator transcription factor [Candidatus Mediterraneibacter faecigallinarum]|uniref:Stage 0 sporulation protein A homolog n=1 Tax=Candidatus Mediterraneibacter faecigallinarum TaxID=2838669 RepID=A0A9D2NUH7_9FIRM|nr:response regulator transcription factor [Candidatus Mediterraneibacter faecigallinarum]
MKTILIVDDDVCIGDMLQEVLVKEGYRAARAYSGTEALLYLSGNRPDLILLDLMLPGLSGEELLPLIEGIPVIVVSARSETADKVELLLSGADDYITKPFDTDELLARIAVQLRRPAAGTSSLLAFNGIRLDTASRTAEVDGQPVRLTKTEYAILKLLMQNPSQVITKSVMLDRISEDTPDCVESSLKVHVSNLRKKLKDVNGKDYIEAVWGIGFKMNEG